MAFNSAATTSDSSATSLHSQDSNELLSLRFSDGDMVIKLGASPDKWLLVHKEVIKVAMPILGVGLSTQWSHPDLRTNPITGVEVEVHTLGMKFADGTHVLEGKEFAPGRTTPLPHMFSVSSLCGSGWPDTIDERLSLIPDRTFDHTITLATHAFKALLSLVYGAKLSFNACNAGHIRHTPVDIDHVVRNTDELKNFHTVVDQIINVCAYAEFYGCLEQIASPVKAAISSTPVLWAAVADRPEKYVALAKKLRAPYLFVESMRHLITQHRLNRRGWLPIAETADLSVDDAQSLYQPLLQEQVNMIKAMQDKLMQLQLCRVDTYDIVSFRYPDKQSAFTTLVNALDIKGRRCTGKKKAEERADFYARSIWGQWLAQQINGDVVYPQQDADKPGSDPAGPFSDAVRSIEHAARSINPSALFGSRAAQKVSEILKLDETITSPEQIDTILFQLLLQAAGVIEETFRSRIVVRYTYRRCQFEPSGGAFSYLGMDEKELPWDDEDGWNEIASLPEVNMDEAAAEVVEAYGRLEDENGGEGSGD